MGVRDVLNLEPVQVAKHAVGDVQEQKRRAEAKQRIRLFCDDIAGDLRQHVDRIFNKQEVKDRLDPFIDLAGSHSLLRRIAQDVCRHTYRPGPNRLLKRAGDTRAYAQLAKMMRLDRRMDLAMKLAFVGNAAFVHPRYVPRKKKIVLDVLSADMVTVIPDPDDPLDVLAFIYDVRVAHNRTHRIYWDDAEVCRFDENWAPIEIKPNEAGVLPIVPIYRTERWGAYWDTTTGTDLVHGTLAVALNRALAQKHLKSQGWQQIVIQGDTEAMEPNQPLDQESGLVAPEGTTLSTLDLQGDAQHYRMEADAIAQDLGASYGINRERLNAKATEVASDISLLEMRQEQIDIASEAEHALLAIMPYVGSAIPDPAYQLREGAEFDALDFFAIEARVSTMEQLQIWDKEEQMGISNILDVIMSRNPEIADLEGAMKEYTRNLKVRAIRIEQERRMNAPRDMVTNGPGQDPEVNGAQGAAMRGDGNGVRGFPQGNEPADEQDDAEAAA